MWGKELEKEGAAWIAGYMNLPMLAERSKPKMFFDLVGSDAFLDFENVAKHVSDVVSVAENKCFFDVKSTSNNVFRVFNA